MQTGKHEGGRLELAMTENAILSWMYFISLQSSIVRDFHIENDCFGGVSIDRFLIGFLLLPFFYYEQTRNVREGVVDFLLLYKVPNASHTNRRESVRQQAVT